MGTSKTVTVKLPRKQLMASFPDSGVMIEATSIEVAYLLTPRGWEWDALHIIATPTNVIRQRKHNQSLPKWLSRLIEQHTPKA